MLTIFDFAFVLLVGAVTGTIATVQQPSNSAVRQFAMLASHILTSIASAMFMLEHFGITQVVDPAHRDFLIIGTLAWLGIGIIALTVDLYFNIDKLKDDPSYAMFGRGGLAAGMLMLGIFAMTALTIAWYQVDPQILATRGNVTFLYATPNPQAISALDCLLFALDQTQKAMLFDISEVYQFGITDLGNNPQHYSFSTLCLVYRTYFSIFVIAIALRLMR
jgi:hypothetical protein